MKLKEMIKVMQHYEDGGEVECSEDGFKTVLCTAYKERDGDLCWNWDEFDYRIKEQKQKITIEKWLLYDSVVDVYFECRTSDIDKMLKGDSHNTEKVKLIKSYEVEL